MTVQSCRNMNVTFGTTSEEIWLEEDITPVFADQYWSSQFFVGLIIIMIIGMLHIFCYTYYRPFKYDLSQKLIKLETMNLEPILQKDITYFFLPYINDNYLMNIIFEYSGITNDMDNLNQFLNSIMSSNISHSSSFLFRRFSFNLLLWIIIIITYILLLL